MTDGKPCDCYTRAFGVTNPHTLRDLAAHHNTHTEE
jgi:hypothetical protein